MIVFVLVFSPISQATYQLKALAHYNWNCKKSSYCQYTLQLFFTTATIFSTVLYMGKDFYKDFFRKIFVKIFVVCEGLKALLPCKSSVLLSSSIRTSWQIFKYFDNFHTKIGRGKHKPLRCSETYTYIHYKIHVCNVYMYSVSTRKKVDSVVLQSWKQMKMGELHEVQMTMDWIDNKNYSAANVKKTWLSILHAVLSISIGSCIDNVP